MSDPILQLVTRATFVAIFALTLVDLARGRTVARLEVAALFGTLAVTVLLQALGELRGGPLPGAELVGPLLLVTHPYLLLRIARHFRPVPTYQQAISVIGLVTAWLAILWPATMRPAWVLLPVGVAFAYVEVYATYAFVRAALETRGIARRRLAFIASASGLLAAIILLAIAVVAVPAARDSFRTLTNVAALGIAAAYYFGFTPPGWLRRSWQMEELRGFMRGLVEVREAAAGERVAAALDYVGPAAARAAAGKAGVVALGDEDGTGFRLHYDPTNRAALEAARIAGFPLEGAASAVERAWRERRAIAILDPAAQGDPLRALATAFGGAGAALVAPLVAGGRRYGLLIVLRGERSLFLDDDLGVLEILAEQASAALEGRRLFEEMERERVILAAVLVSMRDGLLVLDAERRVRYGNARAVELLGARDVGLLGADEDAVLALLRGIAEDPVRLEEGWREALASPTGHASLEVRVLDPAPRDVSLQFFRVRGSDGGDIGVGTLVRDVTAERDLARAKDELVSVVSHELRTPLASLVGFAELLLTRQYREEQRQEFLQTMLREGRRLTALINDFLDLQRMEGGTQQVVLAPADLGPLLQRAVDAAGNDPLHPITLELPADLPTVRADADRVLQVVLNLLSNARKYSPAGGPIHLAARRVDGAVEVSMVDQGLGIPPEALPHVFGRFYRVDNSDRRQITGTGLGLAIVRNIVEAHGGSVRAESQGLGHGSHFAFTLPLAPVEQPITGGDDDGGGRPDGAGRRSDGGSYVLIVEDDPAVARWLAETLVGAGYAVRVAHSGEHALKVVEDDPPAALLLNLTLGGSLDGWDTLAVLRCRADTAELPVIVVSGRDEQARGRALGVSGYLTKPVTMDVLLRALQRLGAGIGRPVLVVEDDAAMREAMVQAVTGAGFRTLGVGTGEEALKALDDDATNAGLLILDLGLPGMDGFEVLEVLRGRPGTRDLPVLVVTGRELSEREKAVLSTRAVQLLRKDDGIGVPIVEAVARALGGGRHAEVGGGSHAQAGAPRRLP